MMASSSAVQSCPYCGGGPHIGICHMIKAIEYHQNGSIKRVEMKGAQDFAPVSHQTPWPDYQRPFWQSPVIASSQAKP